MAIVNPVSNEKAPAELRETYQQLQQRLGKVPNVFAVMAHRPKVLGIFLPLYSEVIQRGTIEPRFKELVYLKTSMTNGCEY